MRGLIQFYEMSFELAWKIMKDYLDEQGFVVNSPRQAIKQTFQIGLIENGHVWINLEFRSLKKVIFHFKFFQGIWSIVVNCEST